MIALAVVLAEAATGAPLARDAGAAPVAAVAPAATGDAGPAPVWTPPVVHTLALFTAQRVVEAALWPEPFADVRHFGDRWAETFSRPPIHPDGDAWGINVVGHGLMGSELYLRARTCHFGGAAALAFAAASTVVWEYAFEGNAVRPSSWDLVWTPLAGLALGEVRYQAWRALRGVRGARWLVDPLGELERGAAIFPC